MATTSILMNRELAAEVRRLAGTRAPREAMRSAARAGIQTRRLREKARAIAAGGDPFYPGYAPREIREKMWRAQGDG